MNMNMNQNADYYVPSSAARSLNIFEKRIN